MATCVNHPVKAATARCKSCNAPLCNQCKVTTKWGIFCSDDCAERTKAFTEKLEGPNAGPRKKSMFDGLGAKIILLLIVLVCALAVYLVVFEGVRDLDDLRGVIDRFL